MKKKILSVNEKLPKPETKKQAIESSSSSDIPASATAPNFDNPKEISQEITENKGKAPKPDFNINGYVPKKKEEKEESVKKETGLTSTQADSLREIAEDEFEKNATETATKPQDAMSSVLNDTVANVATTISAKPTEIISEVIKNNKATLNTDTQVNATRPKAVTSAPIESHTTVPSKTEANNSALAKEIVARVIFKFFNGKGQPNKDLAEARKKLSEIFVSHVTIDSFLGDVQQLVGNLIDSIYDVYEKYNPDTWLYDKNISIGSILKKREIFNLAQKKILTGLDGLLNRYPNNHIVSFLKNTLFIPNQKYVDGEFQKVILHKTIQLADGLRMNQKVGYFSSLTELSQAQILAGNQTSSDGINHLFQVVRSLPEGLQKNFFKAMQIRVQVFNTIKDKTILRSIVQDMRGLETGIKSLIRNTKMEDSNLSLEAKRFIAQYITLLEDINDSIIQGDFEKLKELFVALDQTSKKSEFKTTIALINKDHVIEKIMLINISIIKGLEIIFRLIFNNLSSSSEKKVKDLNSLNDMVKIERRNTDLFVALFPSSSILGFSQELRKLDSLESKINETIEAIMSVDVFQTTQQDTEIIVPYQILVKGVANRIENLMARYLLTLKKQDDDAEITVLKEKFKKMMREYMEQALSVYERIDLMALRPEAIR